MEIYLITPHARAMPDTVVNKFCCVYVILFEKCGLRFPIPSLLLEYLKNLKINIPQMCPNLIQMVISLVNLSIEVGVTLTVTNLLHLYVVKMNSKRDPRCFYLSKSPNKGVIQNIPRKDTDWGMRYLYFSFNEHSLGVHASSFQATWVSAAGTN